MLMISPTGIEVPIGQTLKPDEYIGMTRSVSLIFIFLVSAVSLTTLQYVVNYTASIESSIIHLVCRMIGCGNL